MLAAVGCIRCFRNRYQLYPAARLTVIGSSRFETDRIIGITPEDFLLSGG